MWEIISALLLLINGATLYWALTKRMSMSPEVRAIIRAVHKFEQQRHTILKIEQLDPDEIFLRNPGR